MPVSVSVAVAGVFGAIFGSFLNVVIHRVPRRESLVSPSSHCPSCGVPVRPIDNIPVLSWLILRGRCRGCHAPISPRYPAVELTTAVLVIATVVVHPSAAGIALGTGFVLILVPCAVIDLEHRIIPNVLTGAGAAYAVIVGTALDPGGEPVRLIAGAAAGGFLLLAALAYPRGMGMGDVKLAGMMGLYLGAAVAPAMLAALAAGVLGGVVVMARSGTTTGRKTAIPFGPYLAFGGLVGLFVGEPLLHAYVNTFVH